jgi:hypothetical protein
LHIGEFPDTSLFVGKFADPSIRYMGPDQEQHAILPAPELALTVIDVLVPGLFHPPLFAALKNQTFAARTRNVIAIAPIIRPPGSL